MLLTTSCMGRLCALFTSHTTKKSANGRIYSSGPQTLPKEHRPTQLSFGSLDTDEPRFYRWAVILALSIPLTVFHVSASQRGSAYADSAATAVRDVQPLNVGDPIPDELWEMPLQVVNHPEGKETITLEDYSASKCYEEHCEERVSLSLIYENPTSRLTNP